jgi:hypothetical protein
MDGAAGFASAGGGGAGSAALELAGALGSGSGAGAELGVGTGSELGAAAVAGSGGGEQATNHSPTNTSARSNMAAPYNRRARERNPPPTVQPGGDACRPHQESLKRSGWEPYGFSAKQ